jgi:hypothetical protein
VEHDIDIVQREPEPIEVANVTELRGEMPETVEALMEKEELCLRVIETAHALGHGEQSLDERSPDGPRGAGYKDRAIANEVSVFHVASPTPDGLPAKGAKFTVRPFPAGFW